MIGQQKCEQKSNILRKWYNNLLTESVKEYITLITIIEVVAMKRMGKVILTE